MQIVFSFYFQKHIGVASEDGAILSFQSRGGTGTVGICMRKVLYRASKDE